MGKLLVGVGNRGQSVGVAESHFEMPLKFWRPLIGLHRAWAFHTHERAVAAARDIAAVYGQPVDVVKLWLRPRQGR